MNLNKKLLLTFSLGIVIGGFVTFLILPKAKLGVNAGDISYGTLSETVTNSSTSCSAATSTLIVNIQSGRTNFSVTNDSSNNIYLCKATSTCLASTGIRLNANGGYFEQTDAYQGGYSCIASTATSTLTSTNAQ